MATGGFTADGTPTRPYSGPAMTGGNAPRSASFQTGRAGDPDSAATVTTRASSSLTADSLQFNAAVPQGVRPTSVLQPIESNPGGLGMSAGDAARRTVTGQYLGSVNGTSQSSWEPAAMLRLSGQNAL
jgi:hypothetical protein